MSATSSLPSPSNKDLRLRAAGPDGPILLQNIPAWAIQLQAAGPDGPILLQNIPAWAIQLQAASRCTTDFASKHFLPDRLLQSSDHAALDSAIENATALMRYGCFAGRTA